MFLHLKKTLVYLLIAILALSLIQFLEEPTITGDVVRSKYSKPGKKVFADKDIYILLPNQKDLKITLTAQDTYIWKSGWFCKKPCYKSSDWTIFDFEGEVLPSIEQLKWMDGLMGRSVTLSIPREQLKNGKNYFAAYTCEGIGKCNDNKWLLFPINIIMINEVSDLSVSSIYYDLAEHKTGSFFIIIKNSGNTKSPSGILSYKLRDFNTKKTISEDYIVMPSTLPGKTSVTTRVSFPYGDMLKGELFVSLDPNNKLIELNEENNNYYMIKEFNLRYPEPPK